MPTNPLHNPAESISRLAKKWRGPALERPLWSIIDWPTHFENSHTRKLARLPFVLLPTKHDGKSYRRLMRHAQKAVVFACWTLIAQLAAKTPARGYLADEDGPYTALDMADMTGMDPEHFTLALTVLSSEDIRWMDQISADSLLQSPDSLLQSPDSLLQSPDSLGKISDLHNSGDSPELPGDNREQEKRREEKRREEKTPIVPKGDKREPASSEANFAAEKKEGAGPVDLALDAARRCFWLFGADFSRLSSLQQARLTEHAECGALPLSEKKWGALAAMRAERAAIQGLPDDINLRHAWLISKDSLIEHLPKAADIAFARRPCGSPPARTPEKKEPASWREKLAALYPAAHVPGTFSDLPGDIRAEIAKLCDGLGENS